MQRLLMAITKAVLKSTTGALGLALTFGLGDARSQGVSQAAPPVGQEHRPSADNVKNAPLHDQTENAPKDTARN